MPQLKTSFAVGAIAVLAIFGSSNSARADSRGPTVELARTALGATSDQWVAFRNYNDRQWIYFTGIVTWHCALKQINYSINSEALDQIFPLPDCNAQTPYSVDPESNPIYINMKLGDAQSVSVQITFADGTKSEINSYQPCKVEDDTTCAVPLKPEEEN